MTAPVFLTAEWRCLLMLNFPIDPDVLRPLTPAGTELDYWQNTALVSLVGFRFLKTRVLGCSVPGHQDFDEVNLRFYVKRETPDGWRRGVVFIKEIVPRRAIAWVARWVYNENYVRLPMRSEQAIPTDVDHVGEVRYEWQSKREWMTLRGSIHGLPQPLVPGSEAEFITEHFWGYARQPDGSTKEYQVEHPRWNIWPTDLCEFTGRAADLYGDAFADALRKPATSGFVADGSPIVVRRGQRL